MSFWAPQHPETILTSLAVAGFSQPAPQALRRKLFSPCVGVLETLSFGLTAAPKGAGRSVCLWGLPVKGLMAASLPSQPCNTQTVNSRWATAWLLATRLCLSQDDNWRLVSSGDPSGPHLPHVISLGPTIFLSLPQKS